ncbi:MAG TPA: arylesterase [Vicinamibacteria bacterium]
MWPVRAHPPIIAAPRGCCLCVALVAALAGCGKASREAAPAPADSGAPIARTAVADKGVVLAVGTSLTAGYGLPDPDLAYPGLLEKRVEDAGLPYRVVNAGVSGETSAGALRRMDWLLRQKVDVFVLETGANDALRGQDPGATRANIDAILTRAAAQSPPPRLVLLGMKAPPNFGAVYGRGFDAIYPELARKHGAVLVPFVLEGVAGIPRLNQADGIHPTEEGQRMMADLVWTAIKPLLDRRR